MDYAAALAKASVTVGAAFAIFWVAVAIDERLFDRPRRRRIRMRRARRNAAADLIDQSGGNIELAKSSLESARDRMKSRPAA
ncbi:MAG: hypothetical protein MI757_02885 [Pirellulales bacterium]|nr:hypothetical protein [Pirellulales bacterium]